jgi:hypothetical protein
MFSVDKSVSEFICCNAYSTDSSAAAAEESSSSEEHGALFPLME